MYYDDFANPTYPRMSMYPGYVPMPGGMPYPNIPTPTSIPMHGAMPMPTPMPAPTPAPEEMPSFDMEPTPPVMADLGYTQAYLKTQIGRYVKIEFLIGTNMLVDREGTLVDVGISYVIIREPETDDLLLCDIYSIKFVRFYY